MLNTRNATDSAVLDLRTGETVEVRGEDEIRATLDVDGALDGLPFIPEMRRSCGGVFRVYKRAEKTCCEGGGLRRMPNAVFLEGIRCDGSAHDGCGRMCLLFWKEAWLKRTGNSPTLPVPAVAPPSPPLQPDQGTIYHCQSTELMKATTPLRLLDLSQYVRDFRGGQMSPVEFAKVMLTLLWNRLRGVLGLHDIAGPAANAGHTPSEALNLQPGELVEFKTRDEIRATLDPASKNRGLVFCQEMLRFCGHRYRVLRRVDRMILETTGAMCATSNAVLLEAVACDGRSHRGCMRNSYYICKEIWLKRVENP